MTEQDTKGAHERVTVTNEELAEVIRECAEDGRRDARRERADFAAWIEPLALRMAEEIAVFRAPVDVEGALSSLAVDLLRLRPGYEHLTASLRVAPESPWGRELSVIKEVLLPLVQRAAQFAREAEGLRAANLRLQTEVMRLALGASTLQDDHAAARAALGNALEQEAERTRERDAALAEVERLRKSIATFTTTPEEVASCAVFAEVAGKPAREAVLYLASLVRGSREAYARRRAAQRAEDEEGPLAQARALLQRARIRLVDEPDSANLHAEIDAFLAGLPIA